MGSHFWKTSIKWKLIALFLPAALVSIVAISTVGYLVARSSIKTLYLDNFLAIAQGREMEVVRLLQGKEDLAVDQADNLYDVLRLYYTSSDKSDVLAQLSRTLGSKLLHEDEGNATFVIAPNGVVIASTDPAEVGTNKSGESYFIEGQKGMFFKDVYHSKVTDMDAFAIAVPILDRVSHELYGVLVKRFDVKLLSTVTGDHTGLGETGEIYVVNKEGFMITESRFAPSSVLKQQVDSAPVRQFQGKGEYQKGEYINYRGVPVLGAAMGDEIKQTFKLNWLILTEIEASEAFTSIDRLRQVFAIIAVIAGALIALLAFMAARSLSRPINELATVTLGVAQGDLTATVTVSGEDEVGILASSFGSMLKDLRHIVGKIQEATTQITSSSSEILAASQQQAASAREQASAVTETTSAATELSKGAEHIGESSKHVSLTSAHALAGMAKIREAIGKTGERLTSLSEKSQQIGKITGLINDIADQTNLLAVNAAIEAARAGEHGRGFSVVADEIRKLADSTGKSTKDITALVEIIQHDMSNAIISMEQSVGSVNEEARLTQESAESAKEIAMSATQQVLGTKQISEAMININTAMKEIAIGAQQAQVAAQQLATLSVDLRSMSERFKV